MGEADRAVLAAAGRDAGAVRMRREDAVAHLVWDAPWRRNAMDPGMMLDLGAAVGALVADPPGAVVMSGVGGAFCAGGDLAAVRSALLAPAAAAAMARHMAACTRALSGLPCLVVAAVEGAALGGGAELLLAADLVVASAEARIGFVQGRMGVSPGWGGGALLVERVGARRARRILLEGAVWSAAEAAAAGVVDEVVPAGDALSVALSRAAAAAQVPVAARRATVAVAAGEREEEVFLGVWGGEAHQHALSRATAGRASR